MLSFFKRNKKVDPVDFSVLGTDLHSHLIPGIDDGSKEISESIGMIKHLQEMGFKRLITTPHIMHDYYKNNANNIFAGLEELNRQLKEQNIDVVVDAAAEYMLDDGFGKRIEGEKLLTIDGKKVLVEMSPIMLCPAIYEHIFNLQIAGYEVVLAHPERYSYWFNQQDKYADLKDRGVLFQINTISLGGYYGPAVKKCAHQLIKEGFVDYIGSDMHNQNYLDGLQKARTEPVLKKLIDSGVLKNNLL